MRLKNSPLRELLSASDEDLARLAKQETAAFAELYHRHINRVYRYHIARLGSIADAQDLTAQTFLAALEGIASYRGSGSFAAWLMGIAHNKLSLYYRQGGRIKALEEGPEPVDPEPALELVAGKRLQFSQVCQALTQLSTERAEAITLHIFADLSAAETGRVMGKSDAAVKMLVQRGLRELRQQFVPLQMEEL
jgi:RNA polymerase sigma-70 factor (ECF subfamily)